MSKRQSGDGRLGRSPEAPALDADLAAIAREAAKRPDVVRHLHRLQRERNQARAQLIAEDDAAWDAVRPIRLALLQMFERRGG